MDIETNEKAMPLKRTKTSTISLTIFCFGILYLIYLLKRIYLVTNNPLVFNILDMAEWPLYIFVFLNAVIKARYRIQELMLIAGIGSIFILGYITTGYAELLKAMMIIVALKNVDYKELFEIMYRILVFSIVLTFLLYLLGLSDAGVQRRGANALGYAHANSVGYVLMALVLITISKKDKISPLNKILLALLNLFGYIIANSRTGFFLACIALICSSNKMYAFIKRKRLIQNILIVLPVILMMATLFTAVLYESNSFVQNLDMLFNGRIKMNNYILMNKGITLLGQSVEYHGLISKKIYNSVTQSWSNFMTIDNAYMSLIIEFGLLATIVVGIAYFKLIRKLIKYNAIRIVFVIIILFIYGLTESSIISIYVVFPFVLLLNDRMQISERRTFYDT